LKRQKNELREKELYAERERNEVERQKNELREKELAAEAEKMELREKEVAAQAEQRAAKVSYLECNVPFQHIYGYIRDERAAIAEQRELRKAELIIQERSEREKRTEQHERLKGRKLALAMGKLQRETSLKSTELNLKENAQSDEMKVTARYGDALAQV